MNEKFPDKLGIKENDLVVALNAKREFVFQLNPLLPKDVVFKTRLGKNEIPNVVILWYHPEENIPKLFQKLETLLNEDGHIWVVLPKESVAKKLGWKINQKEIQKLAKENNLIAAKSLPFSSSEVATQFIIRKEEVED
jgi:hypothetical protein